MPLPIPRLVWPITITAASNDLVPFYADINGATGRVGTVPAGEYLTPELLATAVALAMQDATGGDGLLMTVVDGSVAGSVSASGVVSLAISGVTSGTPSIYWSAPPAWVALTAYAQGAIVSTTAGRIYLCTVAGTSSSTEPSHTSGTATDGTVTWAYKGTTAAAQGLATTLGYASANDTATPSGGVATFTADYQIPNLWTPDAAARFDEFDREMEAIVTQVETAGGQSQTTRWSPSNIGGRRKYGRMRFEWMQPKKVFAADATGADLNQAFETFWTSSGVGKFRYSPDRSAPTTGAADLVVRQTSLASFKPERVSEAVERFHIEIEVMRYLDASGNESP